MANDPNKIDNTNASTGDLKDVDIISSVLWSGTFSSLVIIDCKSSALKLLEFAAINC